MPPVQTYHCIDVHAQSSAQALLDEHEYAAHNYHPLPVVFAVAEGARVWDPEVCISFISFFLIEIEILPYSYRWTRRIQMVCRQAF